MSPNNEMKKASRFFAKNRNALLLTVLAATLLGPLLYYRAPLYESAPDIFYVKAKVLQVLQGGIFIDPVSGYASMHPPYYHLFLAMLKAIGFDLNTILMAASIFIVATTIYFVFKIIKQVLNKNSFYVFDSFLFIKKQD